jgi:hypothetical protein
MCGEKKKQCSICRKFVQRAIFAYHTENNCANLDESATNNRPYRSPQDHSKFSRFVSLVFNCLLGRALEIMKCEHCKQNYERLDSISHEVKNTKIFAFSF